MKKAYLSLFIIIMIGLSVSGCNKAAHDVQPLYVSSYRYENKTCDSLKQELGKLRGEQNALKSAYETKKCKEKI
jgi:hypothetical protein